MSSQDLVAELTPADDNASCSRLYKFAGSLGQSFLARSGLASAQQCLNAFTNKAIPVFKRRFIGVALYQMTASSAGVMSHIQSQTEKVKELGRVILDEPEDLKLMSGLIIRNLAQSSTSNTLYFPSEIVKDHISEFPTETGPAWVTQFQDFLDHLTNLKLMGNSSTTKNPVVLYSFAINTSDGFEMMDSKVMILIIVQNGRFTAIMPPSDGHMHFLDVPLHNISGIQTVKAILDDSQDNASKHSPINIVLDLVGKEWTYLLDASEQNGRTVEITFKSLADAKVAAKAILEEKKQPRAQLPNSSQMKASSSQALDVTCPPNENDAEQPTSPQTSFQRKVAHNTPAIRALGRDAASELPGIANGSHIDEVAIDIQHKTKPLVSSTLPKVKKRVHQQQGPQAAEEHINTSEHDIFEVPEDHAPRRLPQKASKVLKPIRASQNKVQVLGTDELDVLSVRAPKVIRKQRTFPKSPKTRSAASQTRGRGKPTEGSRTSAQPRYKNRSFKKTALKQEQNEAHPNDDYYHHIMEDDTKDEKSYPKKVIVKQEAYESVSDNDVYDLSVAQMDKSSKHIEQASKAIPIKREAHEGAASDCNHGFPVDVEGRSTGYAVRPPERMIIKQEPGHTASESGTYGLPLEVEDDRVKREKRSTRDDVIYIESGSDQSDEMDIDSDGSEYLDKKTSIARKPPSKPLRSARLRGKVQAKPAAKPVQSMGALLQAEAFRKRKAPMSDHEAKRAKHNHSTTSNYGNVQKGNTAPAPHSNSRSESSVRISGGGSPYLSSTQNLATSGHPPAADSFNNLLINIHGDVHRQSGNDDMRPLENQDKTPVHVLSSNSKHTPAPPNAESMALSGFATSHHIERDMVDAERFRAADDPFKQRSGKAKSRDTIFMRRLTGEMNGASSFAQSTDEPTISMAATYTPKYRHSAHKSGVAPSPSQGHNQMNGNAVTMQPLSGAAASMLHTLGRGAMVQVSPVLQNMLDSGEEEIDMDTYEGDTMVPDDNEHISTPNELHENEHSSIEEAPSSPCKCSCHSSTSAENEQEEEDFWAARYRRETYIGPPLPLQEHEYQLMHYLEDILWKRTAKHIFELGKQSMNELMDATEQYYTKVIEDADWELEAKSQLYKIEGDKKYTAGWLREMADRIEADHMAMKAAREQKEAIKAAAIAETNTVVGE